MQPIAAGDSLLVVTEGRVLDAATGRRLRQYPEAGLPGEVLFEAGTILAIDKETIRALDLATARLCGKEAVCDLRCTVAGDGLVDVPRGDSAGAAGVSLVCRELKTGKLRWRRLQTDLPWLSKVRRCVYHQGLLICEISRFTDEKQGNAIQVFSAADGTRLWGREYVPFATHMKQARAMFIGDLLWILESPEAKSHAWGCVGLDPRTGVVKKTRPASLTHCFPPVATCRYLISGEMDFTDLSTADWTPTRSPRRRAAGRRAWFRPTAWFTPSPSTAFAGRCCGITRPWRRRAARPGRSFALPRSPGRRRRCAAFRGKTRRSTGRATATTPSAAAARRGSCRGT